MLLTSIIYVQNKLPKTDLKQNLEQTYIFEYFKRMVLVRNEKKFKGHLN